jgi:hypothetical protein
MITTIQFIFALIGLTTLVLGIVSAIRNREGDRWAEGLLLGMYIGVLGCMSAVAILVQFGVLQW